MAIVGVVQYSSLDPPTINVWATPSSRARGDFRATRKQLSYAPDLDEYTVLDCEPLHDLKGHLIHLCKELSHLLTGETRKSCEDISTTVRDKTTCTCADHRIVLLQLYLYLQKQDISKNIKDLLETAIRMSEILYLPDAHRTHRVLQLYNYSLFHHELCRELFTKVHAGMTDPRQDVRQVLTCLGCTCPTAV